MESVETVGIPDEVEHWSVAGRFELGSKGDEVLAPETANSSALAAVGALLKPIVITSDERVDVAMPYHSVCVVSCL